jgi:hypothetical protein
MVLLPTARAAYLKSFSLSLGLASVLLGCGLSYGFGPRTPIVLIAGAAALYFLLGIVRPSIMARPYKLWNSAARYFARGARLILMSICFYVVFLAVGRAGTALKLARPMADQSLWTAKTMIAPAASHYEFSSIENGLTQKGWFRSYLDWSKTSGQLWALFLVPFLAMLASVEIYTDRRFPAGVYTLF